MENERLRASEIAGKRNSALDGLDLNQCRAKDMAAVREPGLGSVHDRKPGACLNDFDLFEGSVYVMCRVKRFRRKMLRVTFCVRTLSVFFLDLGAVIKDHPGKIAS